MKNNKGITLVSMIGYVILAIMALAVLVALTTNFKKNFDELDVQAVQDIELDKINMQISKDIKDGKKLDKSNFSSTKLAFIDGNTYTYVSKDKTLYMNDNVAVAEHLRSCVFELPSEDILRVTAQVEDEIRTMEFSLDGVYVARIEKEYYRTLQSAIDAVPANNVEKTITVLTDISENATIAQSQNIVLDIGIYTINNKEDNAVITTSGKLKIQNGKITGNPTKQPLINNKNTGALNIVGGTITSDTSIALGNYGTIEISGTAKIDGKLAIANKAEGIVDIAGGTLSSNVSNTIRNLGKVEIRENAIIKGTDTSGNTFYNDAGGEVRIVGGKISSTAANTINNEGKVEISGSAIIEGTSKYPTLYNKASGEVNISGGTVSAEKTNVLNNFGIVEIGGNAIIELTLKGDEWSNEDSGQRTMTPAFYNQSGAKFTMTGGTIISDDGICSSEGSIINIEGGTISAKLGGIWCGGTLTITGGTITGGENYYAICLIGSGTATIHSSNTTINGGIQGEVNYI